MDAQTLQQNLDEARRLYGLRDYGAATALYESVLRADQATVIDSIRTVQDLSVHKKFLRSSLVLQLAAQPKIDSGFYVNLGPYSFFGGAAADIFVSEKAIAAIEAYKGPASGMIALKNEPFFELLSHHPQAITLLYYAHSVSADVIDFCLVNRVKPMKRVADFGAGAGLQAVTLALLNRNIEHLNLFEIQEIMRDAIVDVFKANKIDCFELNRPIEKPVDCFYSFRACSYLFSIDAYYEEIRKNRSDRSCALFDVGYGLDREHEIARFRSLFGDQTLLYSFGKAPQHYERIMFDEPIV